VNQFFKIMKLTAFLLFLTFFQVSGAVFSQSNGLLNLSAENESVKEILKEIEEQSEYRFVYNSSNIDVEQKRSIEVEGKIINQVLDQLFEGTNVKYRAFDRNFVLYAEGNKDFIATQQQKAISGKVVDESGEPLPGVTVVVKGTTRGTVTNADGEFSLANVPEDATLQFSFVGMKTQEIPVGDKTTVNVTLEVDAVGIEEVVAIGYGTTTKRKAVGAISTLDTEKLEQTAYNNVGQALQGQVPGLIVKNDGGAPGSKPTISIRGGGAPLYVIDGVITSAQDFHALNSDDIESISFLKDASATAVYGSRAGNGIILVTSKRGTEGKLSINYSYSFEASKPTVLPEMMNSYEYARLQNMARAYS